MDIVQLQLILVGVLLPLCVTPARRLGTYGRRWLRRDRRRRHNAGSPKRDLMIVGLLALLTVSVAGSALQGLIGLDELWQALGVLTGLWALRAVVRGSLDGHVRPLVSGFDTEYEHKHQPRRFWAAMACNLMIGLGGLWLATGPSDAPDFAGLEERCYDWTNSGDPEKVRVACNTLIAARGARDTETARLFAARGSAFLRERDFKRAAADYVEAIRIDPDRSYMHYNLGLADEGFQDLGLAIDDFTTAIRIDPDNIDAYLHRGIAYMDIGRSDRAIADFTFVHRARPSDANPLANRGIAYTWTGDYHRATRDFAAARTIGGVDRIGLRGEALLASRTGNLALALRRLDEALRLDPDDGWSRALRITVKDQLAATTNPVAASIAPPRPQP